MYRFPPQARSLKIGTSSGRIYLHKPVHNTQGGVGVDRGFVRVGDKLINRQKIDNVIGQILNLRVQGLSQQEVAGKLGLDRTFISRLETLGEVRKGGTLALVGFPLANRDELTRVAQEEGVEFVLLMTEQERGDFILGRTGLQLLNELMGLVGEVRTYDTVILMRSDKRIRIIQALLDREVVSIEIGKSPIEEDKFYDPEELRELIRTIRS
jgi:transcriptional regulator with XRE-family HTH domain